MSTENLQLKSNSMLAITSVLSILLFGLHWAYEVAHGWETAGLAGLGGVLIMVVWLYGALVLGERRSGQIIMLVGAILSFGVLVLHMTGRGMVSPRIAQSSSVFFWVSSLIALGVTGLFSVILWVHGLVSLRRSRKAAR
jgi:hypothetical protein